MFSGQNKKLIRDVLVATGIGALAGFLIYLWRDKPEAVFLCAVTCGGVVLLKTYVWRKNKAKD